MTTPAARTALLRRLPGCGFVPPRADAEAAGFPGAADADRFASLVAGFAAGFWLLSPDAREAGWDTLSAGAVGPAAAQLAELRPGLDVVPVPQPDPRAAELAALVRELFALPPRARAARRQAWLTERAADFRAWAAAARAVLRTDMPLARLEPRLFDWFAAGAPPVRVARGVWVAARDRWRERKRRKERLGNLAVVVTTVLVLLALGAAIKLTHGNEGRGRPRDHTGVPTFSPAEVWSFQVYDRDRRGSRPPAGYADWVQAGRPQPSVTR